MAGENVDKVQRENAGFQALSTKLSTGSVDKNENSRVYRDLAQMWRFYMKCLLRCLMAQDCVGTAKLWFPGAAPDTSASRRRAVLIHSARLARRLHFPPSPTHLCTERR